MISLFTDISQEVISGIALGSIYALIALGFTLIYKATEVVNFAQGELMMVGAFVNFFFVTQFISSAGEPSLWIFFVALIGSIIFAVAFGWILDFVINRPLKDEPIFFCYNGHNQFIHNSSCNCGNDCRAYEFVTCITLRRKRD